MAARLHIERIRVLNEAVNRPLVLHGGSGIQKPYLVDAFRSGIAKLNIGTAIRQAFERGASDSERRDNVYREVVRLVREELEIEGSADRIAG